MTQRSQDTEIPPLQSDSTGFSERASTFVPIPGTRADKTARQRLGMAAKATKTNLKGLFEGVASFSLRPL